MDFIRQNLFSGMNGNSSDSRISFFVCAFELEVFFKSTSLEVLISLSEGFASELFAFAYL